jgi:hypothetical protein
MLPFTMYCYVYRNITKIQKLKAYEKFRALSLKKKVWKANRKVAQFISDLYTI